MWVLHVIRDWLQVRDVAETSLNWLLLLLILNPATGVVLQKNVFLKVLQKNTYVEVSF